MRLLKPWLLLALTLSLANATTIVINDAYVENPGWIQYGGGYSSDVIGRLVNFDIKAVQFSLLPGNLAGITIWTNYHNGDTTLSPFTFFPPPAPPLLIGDILFRGAGGAFLYGVPVVAHDGLTPGALYRIGGARTAWDLLQIYGQDSQNYRPNYPVHIDPAGARLVGAAAFAPLVTDPGAPGGPLVEVLMQFGVDSGFRAALDEGMLLSFANMTCANDVLEGNVHVPVPEPGTLVLAGAGLIAAGLLRRRIVR